MHMLKFLLFVLCPFTLLFSQTGTGEWRLHVPNRKCLDVVKGNGMVYSAYDKGIVEYDISSGELSLMTSVNSLSDNGISAVLYAQSSDALIIGYSNGNIDIYKDLRITNVPAIKLAQFPGSKRINRIVERNGAVYLATDFAVIKLDVLKKEIKETWYPSTGNLPIQDIEIRNDTVFALTPFSLFTGILTNPALSDPAQWQIDPRIPQLPIEEYRDIEIASGAMYVMRSNEPYGGDSLYQLTASGRMSVLDPSVDVELNGLKAQNDKLLVLLFNGIQLLDPLTGVLEVLQGDYYPFGAYPRPNGALLEGTALWIADNTSGLVKKEGDSYSTVRVEGPLKSEFYAMDWRDGRLVIAGGGLSQISSTFSGSGVHVFENEQWGIRDRDNMQLWTGQNIWDFLSVSINPKDENQIAVSTFSEIPVSILNVNTQVTDTFTPLNSTLNTSLSGNQSSLVSSLHYDLRGNLWVLNGYSDKPLNVYTADGEWFAFESGTASKNKFSRKLIIDNENNKWFSLDGAGLIGYKDNGTISDPTDDDYVLLNTGAFSGDLPSDRVTALAVDFDNELWVGTDNGFGVLYNPESAFDAAPGDYNVSRIKLEFQGNVEYVLGNTGITDIEVDGGNRKWIGTANSGLVLLSPDGLDIIEQFTTDNSPLISNNIIDLEIDHKTGELFIITDLGLISYRSDATYGDPNYSEVNVFPNPVRPGFDGLITIQGIQYNSDIKITDAAGNLIYKTTSNGGTATWNGNTLTGERVPSGIYLIWTAANEGKGRKVGKVLVLNQ
ncbi:MAG: hypothetical protein RIT43_2334 [Bacteroidota bacterium]